MSSGYKDLSDIGLNVKTKGKENAFFFLEKWQHKNTGQRFISSLLVGLHY